MRDLLDTQAEDTAKDPEQQARELSRRVLPKRFYQRAEHAETEGGFAIHLDGRPVKTPAKALLLLPSEELARAVAAEWDAQEKEIDPGAMPLTRIANSAQDAVGPRFAEVADEIARFCGTDALCYRAEEPETLVARQTELWDPVLTWAEELLGHRFVLIGGLIHQDQPAEHARRLPEAARCADTVATGGRCIRRRRWPGPQCWRSPWPKAGSVLMKLGKRPMSKRISTSNAGAKMLKPATCAPTNAPNSTPQ